MLLTDEEFMQHLEDERGNGRDDYPIRAMWNSILAGIVFEHSKTARLIRELSRNGKRSMCGFKPSLVSPPMFIVIFLINY